MAAQVRRVANEGSGDLPAVPITVRQLEAIIRIAESLARMSLQEEATEDHIREAIRLFKHSTMDAVKSGVPSLLPVLYPPPYRLLPDFLICNTTNDCSSLLCDLRPDQHAMVHRI